ncbi:dTMP kinase [Parerythrobacter lacustris]|uniref:Thymidylate kinase n=1 Tax=Parerythrobacter lacustris TaxID=2969984 RepID=A0ABT1XQ61_9SPHN|nr:dTMP kinase [Parerythrobacter lacustris]MCR2833814.1 dTMP kinase [Parerythrobacter lacustris]
MRRGKFIALEGGEGTGKSTQSRLLADWLRSQGRDVVLTREPGGTPGAEAIRSLLLDPPGDGWGSRAEALLFAAARSDHVEKLIRPAMLAGKWVVCDRFIDSSRAYQGGAGKLGDDAVQKLHAIGSEDLRPDLTFLIVVPAQKVALRLARRDGESSDAIGGRDAAYHRSVGETFEAIAATEPERFVLIDGDAAPEQVHSRIVSAISSTPDLRA